MKGLKLRKRKCSVLCFKYHINGDTSVDNSSCSVCIGNARKEISQPHSGLYTMTAEQKKNVDVKRLSNFMCRSLCVIAVLMIVSYFVMVARSVNEKAVSVVSTTLIPIIGSIYMVVKAQRYDRNGK